MDISVSVNLLRVESNQPYNSNYSVVFLAVTNGVVAEIKVQMDNQAGREDDMIKEAKILCHHALGQYAEKSKSWAPSQA